MTAKRNLLLFAGIAGVIALGLAAALSPAVQTWAARRAIASSPWPGASVGSVTFGPGRVSIQGLRIEKNGAALSAPAVDANLGVVAACLGRGFHFEKLVARGWSLDLTQGGQGEGPPADARGAWPARAVVGVLAAFDLPANLSLDGVDLEGDVLFPGEDGRMAGKIHVVVTGGGLAAGRDGRFLCRATAVADDASAPVTSVSANATLTATMEPAGAFARAELRADATAVGRGFPSGVSLFCTASTAHREGRKSYSFSLNRGAEQIGAVDAENPDGSLAMTGSWRLDLRDTDVAPFALGRSLPGFSVAGDGRFETDAATGDIHLVGKLRATADRLGLLARGLAPLGPVALTADFDVARLGASLRVARLDTSLSGADRVASVRALQSFEFNPATGELKVAIPSGDLVGISVAGVPLAWLRSVFPGVGLSGGAAHGEFVMRAEDGRLALRTKAPLAAAGVALSRSGEILASGLEVSAFVLADYAPQGWQVQLAPFAVRSDGIKVLSVEARFGRLAGAGGAVKAAGSWSASLQPLLSMPVAAPFRGLSGGDASGSFEASLDSTREIQVKLSIKNLAPASAGAAALPTVDLQARADIDAAGHSTFSMPVTLGYEGRTSQFAFSGTVAADARGRVFDATLAGGRLDSGDLAMLSLLSGGGRGAPRPGGGEAPTRANPWPALRGKLALKLEGLSFRRVELDEVRGTLHVEPGFLAIEGGTATVEGGGAGRIEGRLLYDPGQARPLSFSADVSVENVDSAPVFRSLDPGRRPAVEGKFDVASHVTGSGEGFADLFDRVQGDFKLSSKDGRFRALHTDIIDSIKLAPSKLVDALDTVSSLFGKKTEKFGQALLESANGLSEIHYDQMNVSAQRGPDLDIKLTAISMIAPEARLTGTGTITFTEGVLIRDQPLSVDLNLGVRGRVGRFLDIVGLLSGTQDELGYTPLSQPIHLGGSLRAVDQSQWKEMLVQASLRKGGGLFDKLLGR